MTTGDKTPTFAPHLAYHPDPDVAAALAQVEAEMRSGQIGSGPLLVRGRPLADYLSLDELARWLRRAPR